LVHFLAGSVVNRVYSIPDCEHLAGKKIIQDQETFRRSKIYEERHVRPYGGHSAPRGFVRILVPKRTRGGYADESREETRRTRREQKLSEMEAEEKSYRRTSREQELPPFPIWSIEVMIRFSAHQSRATSTCSSRS